MPLSWVVPRLRDPGVAELLFNQKILPVVMLSQHTPQHMTVVSEIVLVERRRSHPPLYMFDMLHENRVSGFTQLAPEKEGS